MTGEEFAQLLRKRTYTNSTSLTDSDIVLYANIVKDNLAEEVATNVDEDYFAIRFKRDLKDSSSDAAKREYSLPHENLKHILKAYAKLDENNDGSYDWVELEEYDEAQFSLPLVTESDIKDALAGMHPGFDITGVGIRLLTRNSVPSVTGGLYISALKYPQSLTTTKLGESTDLSVPDDNQSFGMPRQLHTVWLLETSKWFKQSRTNPIPLDEAEKVIEDRHKPNALNQLRKRHLNRSNTPSVPYYTGFNL